jgi:flagellar basal-body rod protein FlgB
MEQGLFVWGERDMPQASTMNLLEKALDAASLRFWALSNNIANANVPNYKRLDVEFASALRDAAGSRSALAVTNERHLDAPGVAGEPSLVRSGSSARTDGNSVDVEFEMVRAAENSIYYAALSRQLADKFLRLRLAITEGRR